MWLNFFLNFENIPNKSTLPKIKENYECSVVKYYKKLKELDVSCESAYVNFFFN